MEFKEKERVEARRSTHFEYTDWNSAQSLNHYLQLQYLRYKQCYALAYGARRSVELASKNTMVFTGKQRKSDGIYSTTANKRVS